MITSLFRLMFLCFFLCSPLFLGACSLSPNYVRPEIPLPAGFAASESMTADQSVLTTFSTENREWWQHFQSQALPRLQALALENNYAFAADGWVLSQNFSMARASRSSLFPSLSVSLTGDRQGSEGVGGYEVKDSVSGMMQANYELDLFGVNRSTANAASYTAEAGVNAWRGAGLALESEVALTYFSLLAARENLAVYDSMLKNARDVLEYQEKRGTLGATAPLDLARQRSSVQSMEAERVSYQVKMNEARNSLCLLLGVSSMPADVDAAMASEKLMDILPPSVDAGLPSDLLARRPDIAEAEARLLSANANIGAARAAFLPLINLTISGGWQNTRLEELISPVNALYSLAGSAMQPIFSGWRLSADLDKANAAKEELVKRYQETTLNAFWEVSTALTAHSLLHTQEKHRVDSAGQASEAYRIARTRYQSGAEDFLSVLDAQSSMLSADNNLVQSRLERLNTVVSLFKALGGGWGAEPLPAMVTSGI